MRIMLLGAPGSGKGTCSEKLVDKLGRPYLSTGDEFRRLKKEGHPLGIQAHKEYKDGGLVCDETVNRMVKIILKNRIFKNGYILDGYPRTIPQAEAFEDFGRLDYVINLDLPLKVAKERILSRRFCDYEGCGKSYNNSFELLKPKQPGVCDYGHGPLKIREDDKPEKVEKRFNEFLVKTYPLVSFYRKKGVLRTINGTFHPDKIGELAYRGLTSDGKSKGELSAVRW